MAYPKRDMLPRIFRAHLKCSLLVLLNLSNTPTAVRNNGHVFSGLLWPLAFQNNAFSKMHQRITCLLLRVEITKIPFSKIASYHFILDAEVHIEVNIIIRIAQWEIVRWKLRPPQQYCSLQVLRYSTYSGHSWRHLFRGVTELQNVLNALLLSS